ncbi:MAG TPA: RdgB/HAM1 family non-canonical purine NTP pyrophosphatase [Bryobacteraceae bacterium]
MTRLFAATGNAGKLREFRMAAAGYPEIEIDLLSGFSDIEPCVETGLTFEENAILKARYYGRQAPGPLFADDSGLEVDALDGAPGVYSARFAGIHATDAANNRLLLEKLDGIDLRTARFVCAIALVEADRVRGIFHGAVEGLITGAPRGPNGFGYDPLFFFPPFGCTFGETTPERKLLVSHRGQALRALFASL